MTLVNSVFVSRTFNPNMNKYPECPIQSSQTHSMQEMSWKKTEPEVSRPLCSEFRLYMYMYVLIRLAVCFMVYVPDC